MRKLIKRIAHPFLKWTYVRYSKKEHVYRHKQIRVAVLPGVFHPGLFYSTRHLLQFVDRFDFENKKVLELGAGSGVLSFYIASKKGRVTASDISEQVIMGLQKSNEFNQFQVEPVHSNLFEAIEGRYDYLFVNPPYYPKEPLTEADRAWFCGVDFEYFYQLFEQMGDHVASDGRVFMVLSKDCDVAKIQSIGEGWGYMFELVHKKSLFLESSLIFEIVKK